ncbi:MULTISPECIES: hypothetical protein [unclassified Caballeronia]|uniref:hypothetical protein n=1 Tax=unclassified Caballeronia TaxID=2646786 RepID=UPI0020291D61|nr:MULTISPECIES: hypothetical protein [unclassified Caballeronia]
MLIEPLIFLAFCGGVPPRSAEGYAMGTLCAFDTVPRVLLPEARATMRDLGPHDRARTDIA